MLETSDPAVIVKNHFTTVQVMETEMYLGQLQLVTPDLHLIEVLIQLLDSHLVGQTKQLLMAQNVYQEILTETHQLPSEDQKLLTRAQAQREAQVLAKTIGHHMAIEIVDLLMAREVENHLTEVLDLLMAAPDLHSDQDLDRLEPDSVKASISRSLFANHLAM